MATTTTYYHCAQRTSYQSQHKYELYQGHDCRSPSLQAHTTYYLNTQPFHNRQSYSVPSASMSSIRSSEEEFQDYPSRKQRPHYSAALKSPAMARSPPPSMGKDNAACSASHHHHTQLQKHHEHLFQYPPPPQQRRAHHHLDEDRLRYHQPHHQHHSYDERRHSLRPDRSYYQEERRGSSRASPPSGSSPSLSTTSISTASFASSPSPKSLPTVLSSPRVPPSFRAPAPQPDTGREDRPLFQDEQLGGNSRLHNGSNPVLPHSRPRDMSAVAYMDTHMRIKSPPTTATTATVVKRPKTATHGRGAAKGRRSGAKVSKSVSSKLSMRSPSFRTYLCPVPGCGATYDAAASFIQHYLKYASSNKKGPHDCPWSKCVKVLATLKSLKDHMQIHAERDADLKLYCPVEGCDKVFGTNRCLRAHELRCKQVKSGERLPCPIVGCLQTFGSTDYVRRHVLDHEKGLIGQEFPCDHQGCDAVLANPLTLQRHKQLHEEQSLGFEWRCLVRGCGKTYSGSKQLTDHQSRIHKDLDPTYRFSCPYNTCQKTFECQRSAYKHACLVERPKCPLKGCICVLPSKDALDAHLWMHETLKTRPPYPCFEEGCSKVFDTKNGILAHALTHTIES